MNKEQAEIVLLHVATILKDINLPFFLMKGTALGAYRDKGFTPTEEDIDFGFLYEDFAPKAGDLIKILVDEGFETESWSLPFSQCRTIVFKDNGIKGDLVSFIRWKDKRFTCAPIDPRVPEPYSIVHDHEILERYRTVELFGNTYNIPNQIEEYLLREYGEDWKTPKLDHISRTRIYNYVKKNGIPYDYPNATL